MNMNATNYNTALTAKKISTSINTLLSMKNSLQAETKIVFGKHGQDDEVYGIKEFNNIIYAGPGNDIIYGANLNDTIYAGDDNDTVYGGDGNDILYGGAGDDILYGGKGNDRLDGGLGDDTYHYQLGDGQDVINNFAKDGTTSRDILVFGEGISASDLFITKQSNRGKNAYDLKIAFKNSDGDAVYLEDVFAGNDNINQYAVDNSKLQEIQFRDGTVWSMDNLLSNMTQIVYGKHGQDDTVYGIEGFKNIIYAGPGNDIIYGAIYDDVIYAGDDNDILHGGEGNDTLYGGKGNDTLHAGKGNDRLDGGLGSDTYIYELGDGIDVINNFAKDNPTAQDVLKLGAGIRASDLIITHQSLRNEASYDLKISFKNATGDAIYLENAFSGSGINQENKNKSDNSKLHQILFADGTKWSMDDLLSRVYFTIHANDDVTDGIDGRNNLILGNDKDNTINAMAGNDLIYGGTGDDMIFGGAGDDVIYGEEGNNDLYGGDGNDIIYGGSGDDLIFGDGDDDIIFGGNGNNQIFGGDGNDRIFGGSGNDTLHGDKGDDMLYGGAGNDSLNGAAGNDWLEGGSGADTYFFNRHNNIDTINNYASENLNLLQDRLVFGYGISASGLTITRDSNRDQPDADIKIQINGTNDILYILNGFVSGNNSQAEVNASRFSSIEFENGEKWTMDQLLAQIKQNADNKSVSADVGVVNKSINGLVDAMAVFSIDGAGVSTFGQSNYSNLDMVLTVSA